MHSCCRLDEDLLKFFVDIVDAKLFEAVVVEHLEAVDVQYADVEHFLVLDQHGIVNYLETKYSVRIEVRLYIYRFV